MIIRQETARDHAAIRSVLVNAFDQDDEANLVEALRTAGALALSLVAEHDAGIVGHIALSSLQSPANTLALAPVSVAKPHQGTGIGSTLIRDAITRATDRGADAIFVLGDPDYYTRFGFSAEQVAHFECEYARPYFMMRPLSDTVIQATAVVYAKPFAEL